MSYLEQLKQQAEQKRQEELNAAQQCQQQQVVMEQQLKPAIQKLYQYLHEVCQQLNYLKPDTQVEYQIEGYDTISNLKQGEYTLGEYSEQSDKFLLRFCCEGQYKFRFAKKTQQSAKQQTEYLHKHNLRFRHRSELNDNHQFVREIFELLPTVFVEFAFVANAEKRTIDLTVRNFQSLGKKFYNVLPDDLTTSWLDELVKYILREPNNLLLRDKYQLTNEGKQQIAQYHRDKDQEEFDLWLEKTQQEQEQQSKRRRGLLGWLKMA